MGLKGYRTYKEHYVDQGEDISGEEGTITAATYTPRFKNVNTKQFWEVTSTSPKVIINRWLGDELSDRSLHEIVILNSNVDAVRLEFSKGYTLVDETPDFVPDTSSGALDYIDIPAGKRVHFYGSAVNITTGGTTGSFVLELRTGSQSEI